MIHLGQDITREHIAFVDVGITGQDERLYPLGLIGAEFGQDLIGIADNRRAATRARAANPGPEIVLDIALVPGGGSQTSPSGRWGV